MLCEVLDDEQSSRTSTIAPRDQARPRVAGARASLRSAYRVLGVGSGGRRRSGGRLDRAGAAAGCSASVDIAASLPLCAGAYVAPAGTSVAIATPQPPTDVPRGSLRHPAEPEKWWNYDRLPAPGVRRPAARSCRRGTSPTSTATQRKAAVDELGLPAFRADQLARQYYGRLEADPGRDDRSARRRCAATVGDGAVPDADDRRCGTSPATTGETRKTLWRLHDGTLLESVLMRYSDRATLCISSQAGCGMACPFCATGQGGLDRNLSTAEIVDQVRAAAAAVRDGEVAGGPGRLSNIVFMGMGEPLANYKRVVHAVRRITRRRPTASASRSARDGVDRRSGARDPQTRRRGAVRSRSRCRCTPPTTSCATPWCR